MGLLVRTVIVAPIVWVILMFVRIYYEYLDPVHQVVTSSEAVKQEWGYTSANIAMEMFGLAIGLTLLGLLIWNAAGPIHQDNIPRRGL